MSFLYCPRGRSRSFLVAVVALEDFEELVQILLDLGLALWWRRRVGPCAIGRVIVDQMIVEQPLAAFGSGLPEQGGLLGVGRLDDLGHAAHRLFQIGVMGRRSWLLLGIERHVGGRLGGGLRLPWRPGPGLCGAAAAAAGRSGSGGESLAFAPGGPRWHEAVIARRPMAIAGSPNCDSMSMRSVFIVNPFATSR